MNGKTYGVERWEVIDTWKPGTLADSVRCWAYDNPQEAFDKAETCGFGVEVVRYDKDGKMLETWGKAKNGTKKNPPQS